MARTQRAFEIQRFLRAGVPLEEAERRYAAGEVLPPSEGSLGPEPLPAAGRPPPALERSRSEEEERLRKVEAGRQQAVHGAQCLSLIEEMPRTAQVLYSLYIPYF